jgi:hypothetical protein
VSASGSVCRLQFSSCRLSKLRAAQVEPKYSVKIGAIMIKVVTVVENVLIGAHLHELVCGSPRNRGVTEVCKTSRPRREIPAKS